ncbi:MAG: DoxX family membrane protein [Minisyncoccia bacterium]
MNNSSKIFLFLMRFSVGWLFFYAGITKVLNPGWSAGGYLSTAKSLGGFYSWLAQPNILPAINFINEWGLTLLGLSLMLGIFVRLSSPLGALLMLLYYLSVLDFPLIGTHSYIVDEHIIYIFLLLFLGSSDAGRIWGLDGRLKLKK